MPEPNSATKPKRKSPTLAPKPEVKMTRVVSLEATVAQNNTAGNIEFSVLDANDANITGTLKPKHATQLIACLKAVLGGRGSGTPRKK